MSLILPELTEVIVSSLDRKDIYECMKVSKFMYSTLAYSYHRKITLSEKDHLNFFKLTEKVRVDGSKIGNFVEHIDFFYKHCHQNCDRDCNHFMDRLKFYQLMRSLPILKKITFSGNVYRPYLQYLKNVPLGDLGAIREISYPLNETDLYGTVRNNHLEVNIRLKDRISSLNCWLLDTLIDFEELTHLSVKAIKSPISLLNILNKYNTLLTFECDNLIDWGLDTTKRIVLKNLESLQLRFIGEIKKEHIHYMLTCMPNLKSLRLTREHLNFAEILSSLDADTTTQFQQYLRGIDHVLLRDTHVGVHRGFTDIAIRDSVFLNFIRGVAIQGNLCNLKVHFNRTPFLGDYFIFEKNDHTINVTTLWLMNIFTGDLWTDRLDFLTFSSITIINTCPQIDTVLPGLNKEERIHKFLIQPIVGLLEREQQKKITCPLFIRNYESRLFFLNIKDDDLYPLQDGTLLPQNHVSGTQHSSVVSFGCIKCLLLTEDLLQSLGRLYPLVEQLTLVNCTFENKQRNKPYHINLSQFSDIHEFTLDVDAIFRKTLKQPLYIIFTNLEGSSFYYLDDPGRILQRLGNQIDIPQQSIVIKISYNKIRRFLFKRFDNVWCEMI